MSINEKLWISFSNKCWTVVLAFGLVAILTGCGQRTGNSKNVLLWNNNPVLLYSSIQDVVRNRVENVKIERTLIQAEAFLGPRLSYTNTKDTFTLVLSITFNPKEVPIAKMQNVLSRNKGNTITSKMFELSTPTIPSVFLFPKEVPKRQSSTGFDISVPSTIPFCCIEMINESLAIAIVRYVVTTGRSLIQEGSYVNIKLTYAELGEQLYASSPRLNKFLDIEYVNPHPLKVQKYSFLKKPYSYGTVVDWP